MTASSRSVVVSVFGRTDVGRTREHNEDAFIVADLSRDVASLLPEVRTHELGDRGSLFMVADGMGGAAAGEIASAMAIEVVLRELESRWIRAEARDPESFANALRAATATTNGEIHEFALKHPEYRGMGTTATIAGLLGDTLYLAQVGDSRAYIVRGGVARQITKDQSLIQKLIEAGELTEEEAATSDRRNIILQALGPEAHVRVDLTHQQVRRGDVLVLCSDGLSGQVSKEQIAAVVTAEPELVNVCKTLIDMANEAGGPDNITVIAARFEGSALSDAADEDHVGHRVYTGSGRVEARTVEMAAVDEELVITEEVPAAERPIRTTPEQARVTPVTPAEPEPRTGDTAERRLSSPAFPSSAAPDAGEPIGGLPVLPRGRGRGIVMGLLALLVVISGWYIFHTVRKVVPRGDAAPANQVP